MFALIYFIWGAAFTCLSKKKNENFHNFVYKIHGKLWGDDIINSLICIICIFISTVQEMFHWKLWKFKISYSLFFIQFTSNFHCSVQFFFYSFYRPYAYDVTEGRPRGVGGQTRHATCTIAKHALRGQTPACLTAELARVRTMTERVSANALCQQNMCAQRDKSWPPAWRRCYGDVTSMHKVYWINLNLDQISLITTILFIHNSLNSRYTQISLTRWQKITNYKNLFFITR